MHLALAFPATFTIKHAPNEQRVAILPGPPGATLPDAIVTFGPLRIKPDEPRPWQEHVATGDLVDGTRAKLGRVADLQSSVGWPMRLYEVEVVRGATDELVELRLCAFYTFMEHAAVAIVRTGSHERMDANSQLLLGILASGRPDWRGEPACLVDVWDLEPVHAPRAVAIEPAAPRAHLEHGARLLRAARPGEALVELDAAVALAPDLEPAHDLRGLALGELGRHADAIVAWTRAAELAPDRADTIYNRAQAHFTLKQFDAALRDFETVTRLEPSDFLAVRKIVQCLYALGRVDDGHAARAVFRERWARTADPRAKFINEYVFDQYPANGFVVHAIETLRPPAQPTYAVLAFRAFEVHDGHEHPLRAAVLIETSAQAVAAGTPFVVGVQAGTQWKVVATAKALPPYPELRRDVTRLLEDAVASLRAS